MSFTKKEINQISNWLKTLMVNKSLHHKFIVIGSPKEEVLGALTIVKLKEGYNVVHYPDKSGEDIRTTMILPKCNKEFKVCGKKAFEDLRLMLQHFEKIGISKNLSLPAKEPDYLFFTEVIKELVVLKDATRVLPPSINLNEIVTKTEEILTKLSEYEIVKGEEVLVRELYDQIKKVNEDAKERLDSIMSHARKIFDIRLF